jgi:hypothetical protein
MRPCCFRTSVCVLTFFFLVARANKWTIQIMLMVLSTLYDTNLSVVSGCLEFVGKINNYLELLDVPDTWVLEDSSYKPRSCFVWSFLIKLSITYWCWGSRRCLSRATWNTSWILGLPRLVGILQRRVQQLLSQREMTHGVWEKNRVQITVVTAAGVVLNHDDWGNPTQCWGFLFLDDLNTMLAPL